MGWLMVLAFLLLLAVAGGLGLGHQRRAALVFFRAAIVLLAAIALWIFVGAADLLFD